MTKALLPLKKLRVNGEVPVHPEREVRAVEGRQAQGNRGNTCTIASLAFYFQKTRWYLACLMSNQHYPHLLLGSICEIHLVQS